MKKLIAILTAILLIVAVGTAFSGNFVRVNLEKAGDQTKSFIGQDSPQPDTLRWDNGSGQYLLNGTNVWGKVRFTCPSDFHLHSIYVQVLNQNNAPEGCDVYVRADNAGNPGALLGGPYHITGPFPAQAFLDAEVTDSISFTAGQSFHVIYGPAPGGTYPSGRGWWLYFDGASGTHSAYGSTQNGPWTAAPYNLLVRAGGDMPGFTDIGCLSTFDDPAQWFVMPSTALNVKAEVQNVGTDPITSYTINWVARNAQGTQVWTATGNYGSLAVGASAVQTASTQFTPPATGYYVLESHAVATGDANPDNDIYLMEMGCGDLRWDWMKYDDGTFETTISTQPGWGYGQRFDPVRYPAQVDSIKVGSGGASSVSDIRIFHFDPVNMTIDELWDYTGPIVQNWNTFHFNPNDVVIFDGALIVTSTYQTGCPMQKDDNLPIAAGNTNMPFTAVQIQVGPPVTLYEETSGDWAFRIFVDSTSAIPPDPVLETSADTLYFGDVTIGTTAHQNLWVKNVGGGDTLYVTNIMFSPPAAAAVYHATPTNFALAMNDSIEVDVSFAPTAETAYNGTMGILNNATPPVYIVRVYGSGTILSVNEPKYEGVPEAFSLSQNYPNPFNPTTEISFGLPVMSKLSLTVYNLLGQRIALLATGTYQAGYHSVTWNASGIPSGIYFYRLETGTFTDLKKMVLIK